MSWLLIQTPIVQNWLISSVTSKLSRNLHTRIQVGHVDFSLFNRMVLQDVLVEDRNRDTLLHAGEVRVNITDWFFLKDKAVLRYIALDHADIRFYRRDSVWNFQFLSNYFAGSSPLPEKKGIELSLRELELTHLHFLKRDQWRGEDMELSLNSLSIYADTLDFSRKVARLKFIQFTQPEFAIRSYDALRPNPPPYLLIKDDPNHLRWNPSHWDLTVQQLLIANGSFRNDKVTDPHVDPYFDGHHIYFSAIDWNLRNLRLTGDTIRAQVSLSTKERSGFAVEKLSANLKADPELMEFSRLDLVTGRSHLRNYFAMHYNSFDDMDDYLNKVRMDGDFNDAYVSSDDIAYFAPSLKGWKKTIRLTGIIRGSVSDLQGNNLRLFAGQNTLLNGNIHLKGLPDIQHTFIDFKSNDFRTTYADVASMIPGLRKIVFPRLDRVTSLRFTGNFTGRVNDFVTSGTLETNLGQIVCNLNMKFGKGQPTVYSGDLTSENLDLGQFLDNDDIGKLSFQGKVHGSGLESKTLNATLDGIVHRLDFNKYSYEGLQVNGTIAGRKFNGQIISADSNLTAQLNGLIDFSQQLPRFDFTATVDHLNLQALHFTQDEVKFDGKVRFNFTGDDIDNFLGSARIYDASLFKKGQRISFDSLKLESEIIDSNKTITVVSNEFEGALVGEFSIKQLPSAFQTFLHKYYPSYVKPASTLSTNQNFSFVITTRNVDQYVDLFSKDVRGFNFSNITGRIDSRQNLLDLNAEVPQFNYKNVAFYDVKVKGRGNFDSMALETDMGEVYLSDSLHFPSTHILLHSINDRSDLRVSTSANQTLTSANISAQVQTETDGIQVRFNPTTFSINSKQWTIDRGGEISFRKDVLTAESLRIYHADQQILISTVPSNQGNWNDIHIDLSRINIGDFSPYLEKDDRLEGLLSGHAEVQHPFDKPLFQFSGAAEQFRLDNDSVGRLGLTADYDRATRIANLAVHSQNKDFHFDLKGVFSPPDSLGTPPIDINIPDLADTRIDILQKYLGNLFSNLDGYASGQLRIVGSSDHLKYLGKLQLKDGSFRVNYTRCVYKIPSANLDFRPDTLDFGTVRIKDTLGNSADFRGRLFHHGFSDLRFDFSMNTNRLLVLNTRVTDNSQFYGNVIARASVTLKGPQENLLLDLTGQPVDSSNLYLPMTSGRESDEANFIVWKQYGKEMRNAPGVAGSTDLNIKLNLTANNYANVYVIIDPLTKDIIKANGHGNLTILAGTNRDLDIRGQYEIERGNYNFTFQSLIHKPFTLSQSSGNYIRWSGSPYDANIYIEAVYMAENVQFSDLGFNSGNSGVIVHNSFVKSYHGPVLVTATLTNRLLRPDISFQISLPPNSPLKNDQETQGILEKIQSDPNELNKQVAFLIVLNSFGPLTNSANTFNANTAVGGIFVNSISGALSNVLSKQFSNAFQKAFKDKSLRVNLNTSFYYASLDETADPNSVYNRTNLNLSVMKSFLNERLTFTLGSALDFGLTAQQLQSTSVQFLPDINAEWKVTPNGRVVLTVFYRDSYNYLSVGNHTTNSTGTSISYRGLDFDRLDELFKSKKKPTPKPAATTPAPAASTEQQGTANNP